MRKFRVSTGTAPYEVVVGRGAWRELRHFPLASYSRLFILTEASIWKYWSTKFLRESGATAAQVLAVPSGENSKSLSMVEVVASRLLARGADRRSLLVLFGGGMVGDLGGFVASTYMRGIDCVQIPTTVVAQVDSSVGGKTAVNLPTMKNLIGTFYPPRLALAEPVVLSTLDERTFLSGFYEVAKHAILADPALFRQLEDLTGRLRPQTAASLGDLLARAVKVKVNVVTRDERESGLRRVLNLGHTVGHALEEVTGYRRFLHGEGVGWGMLVAIRLGEIMGILPAEEAERMNALIRRLGTLPKITDLSPREILRLLAHDKKTVGGKIHWVIPKRVGKVLVSSEVPTPAVVASIRDVQRAARNEQ